MSEHDVTAEQQKQSVIKVAGHNLGLVVDGLGSLSDPALAGIVTQLVQAKTDLDVLIT